MNHCDECGFRYDDLDVVDIPTALRGFARRYRAPLTRLLPSDPPDVLQAHPIDGTWSALEYACHVRDVFEGQRARVELMLREPDPTFEPMGREERVVRDRYNDQDPATVAAELGERAEALADLLASLGDDAWDATATYGYPEPASRDLRWIARHTVHEGEHHLLDIGRVLRHARGKG